MTNILEDLLEACKDIKEIDILGTQKNTDVNATPNETPLLAVGGIAIKKIIRRAPSHDGGEMLETVNHFLLSNTAQIQNTSCYFLHDEKGNIYELRKYNGNRFRKIDEQEKKDYLKRVLID